MSFFINLLILCFPIFIIGPFTAIGYIQVLEKRKRWLLLFFGLSLVLLYLLSFQLINLSWGHAFPGPGYGAYVTLPYVPLVAGIILFVLGRRVWNLETFSNNERFLMVIGAIFLFIFQFSAQSCFQ